MFRDYKGFDTYKLKDVKVIKIHDMAESKEYEGVFLIKYIKPFEICLVDNNGVVFTLTSEYFTDRSSEFAPYSRLSMEIIL